MAKSKASSKQKNESPLPLNGNRFRNALIRLAYLRTGEFSITRIMMVVTFISAILLIPTGLLAFLIWGKVIPTNLYSYVGSLAGGGILQYGVTKVLNNTPSQPRG
jgi:hypothetical protein